MTMFNKDYTLALIKEVGEDDVLVTVNDVEVVVPLDEGNKQAIFDAVSEGVYLVPYDSKNNKFLMTVDEEVLYEVFPELDNEELEGATDDLPEDDE